MIDEEEWIANERKEYAKKLRDLRKLRDGYLGFLKSLDDSNVLKEFEEAHSSHKGIPSDSYKKFKDMPSTLYWVEQKRLMHKVNAAEEYLKHHNLIPDSETQHHKTLVEKVKQMCKQR